MTTCVLLAGGRAGGSVCSGGRLDNVSESISGRMIWSSGNTRFVIIRLARQAQ